MSNVTHASLSWNASVDGPYALIGPISGTIDGNRAGAIRVVARFPAFVPSRTVIPGTLIITNNDPEHPVVRIPLTATAYGGELHAEATSFGDIPVTASSPAVPVLLKNSGNAPVDVELGMPSRSEFVVVTPGVHLEPGASASPTMRFSPGSVGVIGGTVPLVVKGPLCGVRQDVAVSGKGTNGVVLTSPGSVDFGLVNCGTTAPSEKVTVANTGDAAFSFSATLGNSLYDVAPSASSVPAGQSVELTVTPKPIPTTSAVTPDLYGGVLTITSNAPGDLPHVIDLHQTAYGVILTTSQSFLDAGSRVVDDPITVPIGTIGNAGNATVSLNGTGAGGVAMAPTSIPAGGSANGAVALAIDPGVHRLGVVVSQTFPLAVSPVPLCAPAPLVTVAVRPVDRAIDFDSTGNDGTLCAVGHTHRAYCIGSNLYGQIKDGPPYNYEPFTVVKNVSADLVGVSPGSTCFAKGASMTCRTIGYQNSGWNPLPPPWTTTFPANVARIRGIAQPPGSPATYAAAYLVLLANGSVYGAGEGVEGIFGVANPPVPGPVLAMGGVSDAIDVAVGSHHACIARTTGDVVCAGYGYWGEVLPGVQAQQPYVAPISITGVGASRLALSRDRTCALRANGTVACWGASWTAPNIVPTAITDLPFPVATARTSIATVGWNLAALRSTGAADGFVDGTSTPYVASAAAGGILRPGLYVDAPAVIRHAICALEPGGKIACFGGDDPPGYLGGFD